MGKKGRELLFLHHVIVLSMYLCALITEQMHGWIAFCSVCEISSIFLNLIFVLKFFEVEGMITLINGAFVVVTYFFTRVMIFSIVIGFATQHLLRGSIPKDCYQWFVGIGMAGMIVITILNYIWFYKIVMGMLKILRDKNLE